MLVAITAVTLASLACVAGPAVEPVLPGSSEATASAHAEPASASPAPLTRTGGVVVHDAAAMGSRVAPRVPVGPRADRDSRSGFGTADIEPGPSDATTEVLLDRTVLERDLASVQSIGEVIGLKPHLTLGGIDGFRVTALPEGSPLAGIGLKEGDIIHRVNGRELTSVKAAWEAGAELQDAPRVEGEITRNGRQRRLVVHLD